MENKKLKKLTALLLSIAMVFSLTVEAFPAAFAAVGEGFGTPETQESGTATGGTAVTASANSNFEDSSATGRPSLYVDFLGDNNKYDPAVVAGGSSTVLGSGNLAGLAVPADADQSKKTNPALTTNTWAGYGKDETDGSGTTIYGNTIFWVGVGIDRMHLLELLKDGNGIYGLELGFYYDQRYLEPYTGATANDDAGYKTVLEAANINNSAFQNQWSGDYTILEAHTDMKPQTDPVTQEVLQKPSMDTILSDTNWRMTYVSLEYNTTNVDNERFYAENAKADDDTQYLIMIPFRLKAYANDYNSADPQVYLRLARSAGLFSISGGKGNTPYAAWERVTTRNPGHELKLMTNFTGDLDIFGGGKYLEPDYRANLKIENAGGSDNTAELKIKDDPSPTPVSVNTDGSFISGLRGGIGMQLDVHVATGYKVEVTVDYTDSSGNKVNISYTTNKIDANNYQYTFIMPEHDVTVTVKFTLTDATDFWLYLKEEETDRSGNTTSSGYLGNSTVVTADYNKIVSGVSTPVTTILDKDSVIKNHSRYGDLPAEEVPFESVITADVSVHGDYEAVIWFERESNGYSLPVSGLPADAYSEGTGTNVQYVLPTGGSVTLKDKMPKSDVVVHVTYRPAVKYQATLEVHHDDVTVIPVTNVAQLTTTVYDKQNEAQKAYSGVVFEDKDDANDPDRYRHTETVFRVLDRVDASSATGSGSLGGDGRTPMTWSASEDSLTALLATATSAADLSGIAPLDLRWDSATQPVGKQPEEGLRKNALGEFYTDSDISDFYARLMELKTLIENEITASGASAPVQKLTGTAVDGTSYTYYDLSREQVQMYLLDYEAYQTYLAENTQYTADLAQYNADLAKYNQYLADKAAAEGAGLTYEGAVVREPKLPAAPITVSAPALRTATDASAAVAAHSWYAPSTTSDPVTATTNCYLEVRGGRQMAVVLEAGTDYQVKTIELVDPTGANSTIVLDDTSGKLTRNPDYQNEYLFTMPEYDCIVRVTYTKRENQNVKLEIVGDYWNLPTSTTDAAVESENRAELTGYSPNPSGITAVPFGALDKHGDNAQALVGSTVTLRVYKSNEYKVSVQVLKNNGTSDMPVSTLPTATTNLADGALVTFTMPANATRVIVTYTKNSNPLNAHLIFDYLGSASTLNSGVWDSNSSVNRTAYEGDALSATITVQPGDYIYAAEAYTEDGSYPFTLSGNGWNNGAGGTVTLNTTMPDKEYWVKIVFKKGPPDPEPTQILRLTVNDPENTGTDDNWAKIEVTRATTNVATLTAGKGATGGGNLSVSDYTQAGDEAVLTFGTASGYYVTAVAILPDGTGVALNRVSATEATFVVPAASINVIVTFSKTESDKKLYLTLAKTEDGTQVLQNWKSGTSQQNALLTVKSPSIDAVMGGVGLTVPESNSTDLNVLPATFPSGTTGTTTTVAKPGETVTVSFEVSSGWYVNSLTVSGNEGRIGYTLKKSDGTVYDKKNDYKTDGTIISLTAEFVMPDSDVYLSVNYRSFTDKPDIDDGEHQLELVVQDPDNTASPYANNTASAIVSGVDTTARTIPALGLATVNGLHGITSAWAGEDVVIDYSADTGFALEIILVTPAGLHVPVTYFTDTDGKVKARFTMPDSDCTAIVRFKEGTPTQYTANLVLHFPNGTSVSRYDSIGEGSFLTAANGLDSGKTKLYSMNAAAGQTLDLDLLAHDGYYISKITAEAAALGVTVNYTGAFGRQTGDVVMPAADLQINVYFAGGWPDEAEFSATLKVYDSTGLNNSANFVTVNNSATLSTGTAVNTTHVTNGGSVTISPVMDEDLVRVAITPVSGCYASSITVRDSRGNSVPWHYVTGGIAFEMVPANVTVKVLFAKKKGVEATPTVTLHTNAATGSYGSVTVTHPDGTNTLTADGASFGIDVPAYGQTVTVAASPNSPACVTSAYAVTASGAILPLEYLGAIHTDMPQVTAGGTVTFAMPAENVDVYVNFAADSPKAGDLIGMLTVVGASGSGSGVMYATTDSTVTTGTVNASGANSLFAPAGTELTVDLTVTPGYSIKALRVTDGYGAAVGYTWTTPGSQFTLTMAAKGGVRVYVELEKNDPTKNLTAQIVVNNGGEADNKAVLRLDDGTTGSYLSPVHVGDTIHIDVETKPGYRVEYIKIVPAKFGLSATLATNSSYTGTLIGETGSFVMPNEDVVVYVKFEKDVRTRYNVILTATGNADSAGGNNAYMTNGYTHDTSVLVYPNGYTAYTPNTDTIQAAPATTDHSAEWVIVDYAWVSGSCVKSVTVKDSAGNPIPFTQLLNDTANRRGQITFPMVNSDPVYVNVEWANEADLPKYDAILHVIDLDNPAASNDSWGKLTWNGSTPATTTGEYTSKTPSTTGLGLGEEKIQVPAGETVTVDVFAQEQGLPNQTYIKAAYVLCRADGQMIKLNLTPDDPSDPTSAFTGSKTADFVMHPGQNDVYVYFTKDPQKLTDYAAVLMLDSPSSDRSSTATISRPARTGESGTEISDSVRANVDDHGYITATKGELITITVRPAEGYTIDSVLMTPLGIEESQGGTVKLNGAVANTDGSFTYTFQMPAENVAVRVKLKEGIVPKKYKAYLNYGLVEFNADGTVKSTTVLTGDKTTGDWAQASFVDGASTVEWYDSTPREVANGKTVTVGAQVIPDHYILAAYVLTDEGTLVSLSDALEGLIDQNSTDNTIIDHNSSFTMPAEDVHIYVWFSDKAPLTNWHTAVLTAVDEDVANAVYNSGKNSATIESSVNNTTAVEVWSFGEPAHKFIWVAQGETVTVKTKTIDSNYQYVVTSLTANSGTAPTLTGPSTIGTTNDCYYTVPNENTAAVVKFETAMQKKSRLNVVLIDPDNPGEVTTPTVNAADVSVSGGTITPLHIESVTSAGARQVIPDVLSGKTIDFTITPAAGYSVIALYKDSSGTVQGTWTLNTLSGNFTMLNEETTLEIYYFKAHEVTLEVKDTRGTSPVSSAQMTEDRLGLTAETADNTPTVGTYTLPTGTTVTAEMTVYGADTKLLGVLVTNEYGTFPQTLQASEYAPYAYTISNDTNICFVVGADSRTDEYIASVSAVNRPTGTALPTIVASPVNPAHGGQWTAAESGNTVTVTVKVPVGYEAVLTATGGASLSRTTISNASGASELTDTAIFTMPANNVHVTVTYKKVRFTATIQTAGTGSGSATLNDGTTTVSALGTINGLSGSETMTYTATPAGGSSVSYILLQTAGGSSSLLNNAGGNFTMPEDDVTVTVVFDTSSNKHHIVYVTTVDTDGMANNAAQNIENLSNSSLDTAHGTLYTYGDKDDNIFVTFTTEPGYVALVTAKTVGGTTIVVPVTQSGTSGNCTATLVMPDADVEVEITYYTASPVTTTNLTLRLVGHEQDADNTATLTYQNTAGTTGTLTLTASGASSTDPYYSGKASAVVGGTLDLDAWRDTDFIFERMTVANWNGDPANPVLSTEVDLTWNEYLTNGISLFTMPNAETLVTVYYGHPYHATLFVIDKDGNDYNGGTNASGGLDPADTSATLHNKVPTVKMESTVGTTTPTNNPTTKTHDPIDNLDGKETITTTVNGDNSTMPADTEIASVIASTKSGTVHLTANGGGTSQSGVYEYKMSNLSGSPVRYADNVDITVVLRDSTATDKLHTATVYKVGHDNKSGNTAAISNDTNSSLVNGTIWTAGYKDDALTVTVTTETGYYALVTAVDSLGNTVPVIQWAVTGTSAAPISVAFTMPDADLDITVTYHKGDPPKDTLKLTIKDHGDKADNVGTVYGNVSGTATTGSPKLLEATGADALTAAGTSATSGLNPYSVTNTAVTVGTYLLTDTATNSDYYVKSVTMVVTVGSTTTTYDLLATPLPITPRLPVGGAEIIVEFAQGKVTGRPYDPEHSETYNSSSAHSAGNYQQNVNTGDNPDLSKAPLRGTAEAEGWILAESVDVDTFTFVVTVPALFDKNETDESTGALKLSDALKDAGIEPTSTVSTTNTPPTYKFYWWDDTNNKYVEFTAAELTVTAETSLGYADNPKGDYPKGTGTTYQHYGYKLELQANIPTSGTLTSAEQILKDCFEKGGAIYVTATNQTDLYLNGTKAPWIESEKTQVVVQPDNVLKPYDPDNVNPTGTTGTYEDHWISAENRGDYLIVTVPMLNNKAGDSATSVDDSIHRLRLYLQNDTAGDRSAAITDVTDLLNIVNVRGYENKWNQNLEYQDGWSATTTDIFEPYYENDIYYTDSTGTTPIDYNGAKFVVTILTDDEIDVSTAIAAADKATAKTNAAILRKIFDNEGTMGTNHYRMYITSDEVSGLTDPLPTFRFDDYTDFEVPRYYSLSGVLQSWAPTHLAELTLYRYDTTTSAYEADPAYKILSGLLSKYADTAYEDATHTAKYDPAVYNDRWNIDFAFKSSELAGDTYKLVVEKTSHITYIHTDIELDTTITANYDTTELKFSFSSPISLICGDIAPVFPGPDGKVNGQDRDNLSLYLYGNEKWSKDTSSADTDWDISIYNPDSYAYAADLDGNGKMTENDWTILMSSVNWKKKESSYGKPSGLAFAAVTTLSLTQEERVVDTSTPDNTYQVSGDTDLVYKVTEDTETIDNVYQVTEDTDLVYRISKDTARIGYGRTATAAAVKSEEPALPPTGKDEDSAPAEGEPSEE